MAIQLSDFDDTSSVTTFSTFSPALSTDSTMALRSPVGSESVIDDIETPTSDSSGNFSYDIPMQPQTRTHRSQENSRTATPFRPGETNSVVHSFRPPIEHDASTISEFEVEERDRIAKMNAKYNAVASSSYSNDTISSQNIKNSGGIYRPTNITQRQTPSQVGTNTRLGSSQPLHPDLHFPQRRIGNGIVATGLDHSVSPSIPIHASRDVSPPSVERVSSQLPLEENNLQSIKVGSQTSPPSDNRNYKILVDPATSSGSPRMISQNSSAQQPKISSSPTLPPSSRSGHTKPANVNPHGILRDVPRGNKTEQRGDRVDSTSSPDLSQDRNFSERSPSTSVLKAGPEFEYDTLPYNKDKTDYYQHQNSPMTAKRVAATPSSTHKDASPPYDKHFLHSPPRRYAAQAIELNENQRGSIGQTPRNDNKTPRSHRQDYDPRLDGHWPTRAQSYTHPSPEVSSANSKEVRSSPENRMREVSKLGPSPEMQRVASQFEPVGVREQSASISKSTRPPPQNSSSLDYKQNGSYQELRDDDKERDRNRRPRSDRGSEPATSNLLDSRNSAIIDLSKSFPKQNASFSSKAYIDPSLYGIPPESSPRRYHGERVYISLDTPNWYDNSPSSSPDTTTQVAAPSAPEPHRRYSDGDQNSPPSRPPMLGRNSAPLVRSVRWTENLIAPSPVLAPARRKGWFNRRG